MVGRVVEGAWFAKPVEYVVLSQVRILHHPRKVQQTKEATRNGGIDLLIHT